MLGQKYFCNKNYNFNLKTQNILSTQFRQKNTHQASCVFVKLVPRHILWEVCQNFAFVRSFDWRTQLLRFAWKIVNRVIEAGRIKYICSKS